MSKYKEKDYSDIIKLPHPTSKKHPRMSLYARAAQFAPFAALTGHEDAIREKGRTIEKKVCLAEDQIHEIDAKLRDIAGMLACGQHPFVTLTYFVPDAKKEGGAYREKSGHIVKMDIVRQTILFEDQSLVPIGNIGEIT